MFNAFLPSQSATPDDTHDTPAAARRDLTDSDCFVLHGPTHSLAAHGVHRLLYEGSTDALATQCGELLGTLDSDAAAAPPLVVGALPFDRQAPCHLYQPQALHSVAEWLARTPQDSGGVPATPRIRAVPDRAGYQAMVQEATRRLGASNALLRKVVLARSLLVSSDVPFNTRQLLQRLMEDTSVTAYCLPLPAPTLGGGPGPQLIGATPELLLARRGAHIASHPLAGSLPRTGATSDAQAATDQLMQSVKDRHEHRVVVEYIADALSPLCAALTVPATPALRATATMWHLGTRIDGTLKHPDDLASSASLALAARLQPTPALCGAPSAQARALIRALEPFERGFYGGAVGYSDNAGDGDWYVAIRCAEINDGQARLFAGAGIMRGSDPVAEADETAAKFNAMLHALELPAALAGPHPHTPL